MCHSYNKLIYDVLSFLISRTLLRNQYYFELPFAPTIWVRILTKELTNYQAFDDFFNATLAIRTTAK